VLLLVNASLLELRFVNAPSVVASVLLVAVVSG
jgi:hypothetical protein